MTTERQRRTSPSLTVPVYDGYDFHHDIPLAFHDFTECPRKIFTKPVYSFNGVAEKEIVRDVMESMCFSGLDYVRHRAQSISERLDKEKTRVFPDGNSNMLSLHCAGV